MACCCVVQPTESEHAVSSPEEPKQYAVPAIGAVAAENGKETPVTNPREDWLQQQGDKIKEAEEAHQNAVKVDEPAPQAIPEVPNMNTSDKSEFDDLIEVKITKENGLLGLDLVHSSGPASSLSAAIMVKTVIPSGPVATHNASAAAGRKIEPGDFIVKVNNTTADKMLRRIMDDAKVDITFRKGRLFTVSMPKDGKLGLQLTYQDGTNYLIVKDVDPGCVRTYNESASAALSIRPLSRIVAVDGVAGTADELTKKLQAAGAMLELTVSQPPPM